MAQSSYKATGFSDKDDLAKNTFIFMRRKIKGLYPEFAIAWALAFIVMHLARQSILTYRNS